MWFDARAKLAEIAGQPPATSATQAPAAHPVSQVSQLSQAPEARRPAFRIASAAMPLTDVARARAAVLPTAPPICAACGVADWRVSLTDTERRRLHVACWSAEQGRKR